MFGAWRRARELPAKNRAAGRPLDNEREAARQRAYATTESDAAAARKLGITPPSFRQWRTARDLPPKRAGTGPRTPTKDERARLAAYAREPSDHAAAASLGITPGGFCAWRKRRGLPRKNPPGAKPRTP